MHGQDRAALDFPRQLFQQIKRLGAVLADRDDHPASFLELVHERFRDGVADVRPFGAMEKTIVESVYERSCECRCFCEADGARSALAVSPI